MIIAVVLSVIIMMMFSGPVGDFVNRHPSVQMLGLAFLIAIGFMLIAEGAHLANLSIFDTHVGSVPKGYLYFAIAFSLLVEVLNIRMQKKSKPVQLHDYKAQAEREGIIADNQRKSTKAEGSASILNRKAWYYALSTDKRNIFVR